MAWIAAVAALAADLLSKPGKIKSESLARKADDDQQYYQNLSSALGGGRISGHAGSGRPFATTQSGDNGLGAALQIGGSLLGGGGEAKGGGGGGGGLGETGKAIDALGASSNQLDKPALIAEVEQPDKWTESVTLRSETPTVENEDERMTRRLASRLRL